MKQHITIDQLNELSDKGKEKLRSWWNPQEGDLYDNGSLAYVVCGMCEEEYGITEYDGYLPLLSIGQMIEFLDEHRATGRLVIHIYSSKSGEIWSVQEIPFYNKDRIELCDALWEAVKEALNGK